MAMRFLNKAEVYTMMRLAREVHRENRAWPPEIILKRQEIEQATRNVELFLARVGAIDYGMVERVTALKMELDTLYGSWITSEASGVI